MSVWPSFVNFTDRVSGHGNAIGRVRLSVSSFWTKNLKTKYLKQLTFDLVICMRVGHDHISQWIESQCHKSRSNVRVGKVNNADGLTSILDQGQFIFRWTLTCQLDVWMTQSCHSKVVASRFHAQGCTHTIDDCYKLTWPNRPRRRPFEVFTTDAKIIRLIRRRVSLFPTATTVR